MNWNWKWKVAVTATQALYVIFTVSSALSMAPMNGLAAKEWPEQSETRIGLLTGGCVLSLGYANFIIIPCSNIFGRRTTSLVVSLFVIGFAIWEGLAKSYNSFLASRIMTGVPTAISETLMVQVIADLFFVHERARWMGLYFKAFFFGLFIGPIISGNMAQRYGWRSFWWLSTALGVFNTLNLLVLYPETRYRRGPAVESEPVSPGEKDDKRLEHTEAQIADSVTGRGRPSRLQFKLWQPIDPNWRRTLVRDVLSPWLKFFNPIIFWAGCTMFGSANVLLFFNLTQQTLAGAPWHFSASAMGYANFAFVVGGLIGLSTAGPLCDWIGNTMTRRNNNVREAEFRLIAMIPFIIIAAIGIAIGGLALERGWGWPVVLCVGYGFTGVTVTSLPTIAISYAVDCYTPRRDRHQEHGRLRHELLGFRPDRAQGHLHVCHDPVRDLHRARGTRTADVLLRQAHPTLDPQLVLPQGGLKTNITSAQEIMSGLGLGRAIGSTQQLVTR